MSVFVLDRSGLPLMPCSEKRARKLLAAGRARVHRLVPFVIRLMDRHADSCAFQPLRIKLDPGSKATGLALVRDTETVESGTGEIQRGAAVLSLLDLVHRGRQISEALTARRSMRRRRRGNLRYRAPRFLNRTRKAGWLAPSLQHRVDTTLAWVTRIRRWAPVTAISSELVRFDMQALENPGSRGSNTSRGRWLAMRFASTCWRSGVASVPTATPLVCRCRSSTCTPGRVAARTGSPTWRWPAGCVTARRQRYRLRCSCPRTLSAWLGFKRKPSDP